MSDNGIAQYSGNYRVTQQLDLISGQSREGTEHLKICQHCNGYSLFPFCFYLKNAEVLIYISGITVVVPDHMPAECIQDVLIVPHRGENVKVMRRPYIYFFLT